MTDAKLCHLKSKLQESRYRLIVQDSEFAGILMEQLFVAAKDIKRMSTNGFCIYFNASWLEKLSGRSLDFALCHQLMHIKKGHIFRSKLYKGDRYHFACNVIVNSLLRNRGYVEETLQGIGELQHTTLFPSAEGATVCPEEAFRMCPFDPATLRPAQNSRMLFDSDEYWDRREERDENGILVLSPADKDPDDLKSFLPEGIDIKVFMKEHSRTDDPPGDGELVHNNTADLRDFTISYTESKRPSLKETVRDLRNQKSLDENAHGDDAMVERVIRDVKTIPKDWRRLLNHFILVETRDYSFLPPDKRLQNDFFLPDFNEDTLEQLNVLFMVDISASLTNEELSITVNELCSAIEQFNGLLEGTIGFFDTQVRRVLPITSSRNLLMQVPQKGGGTDLRCVFSYIQNNMRNNLPSEIVIMTDGKCDFPDYSQTMGIPVLWLLTNNKVRVPWGQAAHVSGDGSY